jgi:hypothetical protein
MIYTMLIQIHKHGQSMFVPAIKSKTGAIVPVKATKSGGSIIKVLPKTQIIQNPIQMDESKKRRIQSLIERL